MIIRRQRKISQKELSDKSGVNLKSLSRYELGTSIPPADVLKAIADGLDVSADAPTDYDKERILYTLDGLLRDAKTRKAYAS